MIHRGSARKKKPLRRVRETQRREKSRRNRGRSDKPYPNAVCRFEYHEDGKGYNKRYEAPIEIRHGIEMTERKHSGMSQRRAPIPERHTGKSDDRLKIQIVPSGSGSVRTQQEPVQRIERQ